jgi:hypothetical protein
MNKLNLIVNRENYMDYCYLVYSFFKENQLRNNEWFSLLFFLDERGDHE